ncbi:hypothetical protein JOF56_000125 [Kibdelosporangium banguiense]|uniref:Uncharacterized protein n=1 Tax=Kibdelosporangium banguiense TaxID=1365924 RepID=A0ABS4T5K2_9PSEU|nr:hypothetical protein [Kibdelosporangium banguiense]
MKTLIHPQPWLLYWLRSLLGIPPVADSAGFCSRFGFT